MNSKLNKPYFVPASDAQKYRFFVGTETPLTVVRDQQWLYQVEQDNKMKPLGNLVSACQYLHSCQAEWVTEKNKKKRMFYHREVALQMLREGYSVVHIESGNLLSYTADYSRIVCSSSIVLENDIPTGTYCIDFTEPRHQKTYKEVQAEKRTELEAKLKKELEESRESRREAYREFLKKHQLKRDENATISQPELGAKENTFKFLKIVGAAAVFFAGLGIGICIKKNFLTMETGNPVSTKIIMK